MNSADCKALLVKKYPETLIKEWKRETKYSNVSGITIRIFRHPVVGKVFVEGYRSDITTDENDFYVRKPSSFSASEFYFSIIMSDGEDFPANALVWFAHKPFFDANGYLDEVSLDSIMETLIPDDMECYEEADAMFAIHDEHSFETLQAMFIAAGFSPSERLAALVRGQS
jgi:hypothetical protein